LTEQKNVYESAFTAAQRIHRVWLPQALTSRSIVSRH